MTTETPVPASGPAMGRRPRCRARLHSPASTDCPSPSATSTVRPATRPRPNSAARGATLTRRLTEGRELLRKRLERLGGVVPVAALLAVLARGGRPEPPASAVAAVSLTRSRGCQPGGRCTWRKGSRCRRRNRPWVVVAVLSRQSSAGWSAGAFGRSSHKSTMLTTPIPVASAPDARGEGRPNTVPPKQATPGPPSAEAEGRAEGQLVAVGQVQVAAGGCRLSFVLSRSPSPYRQGTGSSPSPWTMRRACGCGTCSTPSR